MRRLNYLGKIIIGIGVLILFWKVDGFNAFDGYVDNSWEILSLGLLLIIAGIFLIFRSKKRL